jgi:hypothetical protein
MRKTWIGWRKRINAKIFVAESVAFAEKKIMRTEKSQ